MTPTTSFPSTTIPFIIVSVDELITKSNTPEINHNKSTTNPMTTILSPDTSTTVTSKTSPDSPIDRGTTSSAPTSTSSTMTVAATTRKTTTTEKVIQMTIYSNTQSTISRRSGAPPTEVSTWSFTKSTRFTPNQPSDHSGMQSHNVNFNNSKPFFEQKLTLNHLRAEHREYRSCSCMRGCNIWGAFINDRSPNVPKHVWNRSTTRGRNTASS